LDNVTTLQFLDLSKKFVGPPQKHSLRRGINGRSRLRIEIVRHLPMLIDGCHKYNE
jgi:hypothetical protein